MPTESGIVKFKEWICSSLRIDSSAEIAAPPAQIEGITSVLFYLPVTTVKIHSKVKCVILPVNSQYSKTQKLSILVTTSLSGLHKLSFHNSSTWSISKHQHATRERVHWLPIAENGMAWKPRMCWLQKCKIEVNQIGPSWDIKVLSFGPAGWIMADYGRSNHRWKLQFDLFFCNLDFKSAES